MFGPAFVFEAVSVEPGPSEGFGYVDAAVLSPVATRSVLSKQGSEHSATSAQYTLCTDLCSTGLFSNSGLKI